MTITFLNYKEFGTMQNNGGTTAPFHAGFGYGRNVSHVMKADGQYFVKLSPIADPAYSHRTQEVKNADIIKQIQCLVG